jgi:hypothetical protein
VQLADRRPAPADRRSLIRTASAGEFVAAERSEPDANVHSKPSEITPASAALSWALLDDRERRIDAPQLARYDLGIAAFFAAN